MGSPRAASQFRAWVKKTPQSLLYLAGGISLLFALPALLLGNFDPYLIAIFTIALFAAFGTLRQIEKQRGLTWADAAIWLLLWIPFDLRWSNELWLGVDGFSYSWWSVAVTVFALIGWYAFRDLPDFGYRLALRLRDLKIAFLAVIFILLIVLPLGILVDFIHVSLPTSPEIALRIAHFIGIFLTIAIPEELFFRGILLHGLDQMKLRPWMSLFISSFAFGLMHWNNVSGLGTQLSYILLASIAGAFYGWAYRRSGNNLLAPVITHSLVDLIWHTFFL